MSNDFADTAGITLPDTFDATVVDFAGVTELPVTPTNNPATASTDTTMIRLTQQTLLT